jgi:hypothetical protein
MSLYSKLFTKEVLEEAFETHGSLKAMGRHFQVDSGTIKRYMQSHGLEVPEQVRYTCDEGFFSRDTEAAFYIAGFIAADGCIKKDSSVLDITLAKKDEKHLGLIKDILNATNPLYYGINKNSRANPNWNDTERVGLVITSKQLCKDLLRFGVTERKTHTLQFPDWIKNHPLKHHFIRGYFDGDGCFSISLKNDGSRTVEQVHLCLRGTNNFLSTISEILKSEIPYLTNKNSKKITLNSGIHTLQYGGNRLIEKIFNFMYADATIYMDRKYQIGIKAKDLGDTRDMAQICNKEDLERLYQKHMSLQKVADELSIDLTTVHNWAHKHGIAIKESTGSKAKRFQNLLTSDSILEAYKAAGSIKGAAKKLGVGATTLKRYADKNGLNLLA